MSDLDALQVALADEHAAVWTYGVLGARTSQSAAPGLYAALTTAYARHRARRDQLRRLILDAGAEPVPAAVAYDLDEPLVRPSAIEQAALAIEVASTEALTALIATTTDETRSWALTEAIWSATWQLEFGGVAITWPGAPELA